MPKINPVQEFLTSRTSNMSKTPQIPQYVLRIYKIAPKLQIPDKSYMSFMVCGISR